MRRALPLIAAIWLGAAAARAEPPARVVMISIDTLRADHLSCYGYPRETSPFIDRLAAEGVRFSHFVAATSVTAPAHASLFTALYPIQHRLEKNGQVLDDSFLTAAEVMAAQGYDTAAFVSTRQHFGPGNLDQGFALLDQPEEVRPDLRYRTAEQTMIPAIQWVNGKRPDDRFFLFVHLFDVHTPFNPANVFPSDEGPDREEMLRFLVEEQRIDMRYYANDPDELFEDVDAYDGEIRAVDRVLEALYDRLKARGLDRDSVWIVTADHGEGLGNHRYASHSKHIYNEQLRIPLVIHAPGRFAPRVVDALAEHVDVLPTLQALVGAPDGAGVAGSHGRSLVPLLEGRPEPRPKTFAFSQRQPFDEPEPMTWTHRLRRAAEIAYNYRRLLQGETIDDIVESKVHYEPGEKYALQSTQHKLVWSTERGSEFFHIDEDPYETRNLAGEGGETERLVRERLDALLASFEDDREREAGKVSDEVIEQLEELGYIQ